MIQCFLSSPSCSALSSSTRSHHLAKADTLAPCVRRRTIRAITWRCRASSIAFSRHVSNTVATDEINILNASLRDAALTRISSTACVCHRANDASRLVFCIRVFIFLITACCMSHLSCSCDIFCLCLCSSSARLCLVSSTSPLHSSTDITIQQDRADRASDRSTHARIYASLSSYLELSAVSLVWLSSVNIRDSCVVLSSKHIFACNCSSNVSMVCCFALSSPSKDFSNKTTCSSFRAIVSI
mmetsp:Transcript_79359/g.128584  ORF Transcript_79359/g.128584 Transcript_79359/m.128584 type:complete len:242 (+) Transcript_79359:1258-1983(+)